jgi:hypothetical protein
MGYRYRCWRYEPLMEFTLGIGKESTVHYCRNGNAICNNTHIRPLLDA